MKNLAIQFLWKLIGQNLHDVAHMELSGGLQFRPVLIAEAKGHDNLFAGGKVFAHDLHGK